MNEGQHLADFEDAFVDDAGCLVVRGVVPPGAAVRLAPRRYKSPPPFAGVEVISVSAPGAAGDGQRFELSLDLVGCWGSSGVEVMGASTSAQFARPGRAEA